MKTPQNSYKEIGIYEAVALSEMLGIASFPLQTKMAEHFYPFRRRVWEDYYEVLAGVNRIRGDFFHNCLEMSVEDNLLVVRVGGEEDFLPLPLTAESKLTLRWRFDCFVNSVKRQQYGIPAFYQTQNPYEPCKPQQTECSFFSISSLPFGDAPSPSSSSSSAIKKPVKSTTEEKIQDKVSDEALFLLAVLLLKEPFQNAFKSFFKPLNKFLWLVKRKYKSLRQTLAALKTRFANTRSATTN